MEINCAPVNILQICRPIDRKSGLAYLPHTKKKQIKLNKNSIFSAGWRWLFSQIYDIYLPVFKKKICFSYFFFFKFFFSFLTSDDQLLSVSILLQWGFIERERSKRQAPKTNESSLKILWMIFCRFIDWFSRKSCDQRKERKERRINHLPASHDEILYGFLII